MSKFGSIIFLRLCLLCVVKKLDSSQTKLTEEIILKFAPMAIPAVALLQQHDARRDIPIEPAACSDRSSGHSEMGAQSGRKNQLACLPKYNEFSNIIEKSTNFLQNRLKETSFANCLAQN